MTTFQERTYTVEEFEEFVLLPENADKLYEYIGGEIFEVPSNVYVSNIAGLIITYINMYLFTNDIGRTTTEAGGYKVFGERYAPDVAFISYEKQPELPKQGYCPNPPDLAVEVMSSERKSESEQMVIKVANYLAAGTVVWIVRPEKKTVEVYQPGKPVITLHENDMLDGGDVLPGLSIKLSKILK
jgi:Uma2 family endonuclease